MFSLSLSWGLFPFDIAKLRRKSAHSKFFPFFRSSLLRHANEFATNRGSTPEICRKMDGFDGFDTFISNFSRVPCVRSTREDSVK